METEQGQQYREFPPTVFLMVKRMSSTIFLGARPDDTVGHLKKEIEGVIKIPVSNQQLYLRDRVLRSNELLTTHKLTPESCPAQNPVVLHLAIIDPATGKFEKLTVEPLSVPPPLPPQMRPFDDPVHNEYMKMRENKKFMKMVESEEFSEVMQNEEFMRAIENEEFMRAIQNDEFMNMVRNEEFLKLIHSNDFMKALEHEEFTKVLENDECRRMMENEQLTEMIGNVEIMKMVWNVKIKKMITSEEFKKAIRNEEFMRAVRNGEFVKKIRNAEPMETTENEESMETNYEGESSTGIKNIREMTLDSQMKGGEIWGIKRKANRSRSGRGWKK